MPVLVRYDVQLLFSTLVPFPTYTCDGPSSSSISMPSDITSTIYHADRLRTPETMLFRVQAQAQGSQLTHPSSRPLPFIFIQPISAGIMSPTFSYFIWIAFFAIFPPPAFLYQSSWLYASFSLPCRPCSSPFRHIRLTMYY